MRISDLSSDVCSSDLSIAFFSVSFIKTNFMTWKKFSGEPIRQPILDEVSNTIAREYALGNKLKVCIGTDSQVKGGTTEYATVIVFVREGKGGFMYIHQDRTSVKRSEEHTSELQSLMRI